MDLLKKLEELRIPHCVCEDCWYSCPQSEEGCCNENAGGDCNCSAEPHNTTLDEIIKYITESGGFQTTK